MNRGQLAFLVLVNAMVSLVIALAVILVFEARRPDPEELAAISTPRPDLSLAVPAAQPTPTTDAAVATPATIVTDSVPAELPLRRSHRLRTSMWCSQGIQCC